MPWSQRCPGRMGGPSRPYRRIGIGVPIRGCGDSCCRLSRQPVENPATPPRRVAPPTVLVLRASTSGVEWSVCKTTWCALLAGDAPGCVPPPQRTLPVRLRRRALPGTPLPAHPTPPFHRQTSSDPASRLHPVRRREESRVMGLSATEKRPRGPDLRDRGDHG